MTPQEVIAFRKQLGWSLAKSRRHTGITASRLAGYETGHTLVGWPRSGFGHIYICTHDLFVNIVICLFAMHAFEATK